MTGLIVKDATVTSHTGTFCVIDCPSGPIDEDGDATERPYHAPAHALCGCFPWELEDSWFTAVGDGSPANPYGVMEYHLGMYREPRSSIRFFDTCYGENGTGLDVMVRDGAPGLAVMAMQAETSDGWMGAVVPHLLSSLAIDAMTKLRLAARYLQALT